MCIMNESLIACQRSVSVEILPLNEKGFFYRFRENLRKVINVGVKLFLFVVPRFAENMFLIWCYLFFIIFVSSLNNN